MQLKENLFMLMLVSTLTVGCGKELLEEQEADQAVADSVEAAITSIAGASDEQEDESMASMQKSKIQKAFEFLNPIQKAYAAACGGRALGEACSGGTKTKNYADCSIGASSQTLNGNVSLTYSDNTNCDLDTDGETVSRTFDVTRTTGWGAQVRTFSDDHTDYEGNTYGGGGRITKTAAGFNLDILGKHKTRTSAKGRSKLDISIRTTSPLGLDQLARHNRTVDGGTLVISHNLAKYKVTLEPNNLSYTSSCCYPVSGSMDVTYSGALSGSGTVTFTSCGQATVSKEADSYDIEFYSCE